MKSPTAGKALILGAALILATAADEPERVVPHDGGVCVGLAWVRLGEGEKASVEHGPDFEVFRFEGPNGPTDHWWGVYYGNFAQVAGNGPQLFRHGGVVVHRAIESGQFRGYLAEKDGWQNHFFGSVFRGTDADKAFFDKIDFGPDGSALCAKKNEPESRM